MITHNCDVEKLCPVIVPLTYHDDENFEKYEGSNYETIPQKQFIFIINEVTDSIYIQNIFFYQSYIVKGFLFLLFSSKRPFIFFQIVASLYLGLLIHFFTVCLTSTFSWLYFKKLPIVLSSQTISTNCHLFSYQFNVYKLCFIFITSFVFVALKYNCL